jgi:hypothetical protein
LAQAVELVAGRQAGPLRVRLRRAADTSVAAPGSQAGPERLPDLGLELAPARHRLTDLVEHQAVMAKLLVEEGGVAGERAQLQPAADEDAAGGDDGRQGEAHADHRQTREVEARAAAFHP